MVRLTKTKRYASRDADIVPKTCIAQFERDLMVNGQLNLSGNVKIPDRAAQPSLGNALDKRHKRI